MDAVIISYILPRLGKVPIKPEVRNVKPVEKDAKFRPLNDEEAQLQLIRGEKPHPRDQHPHGLYKDAEGKQHFDDFV